MATPRITKPFDPYFSLNSISQGISIWQGWHHVAQKFTRTTLPLYCASVESVPSSPGSVILVSGGAVAAAPVCWFAPVDCDLQPATDRAAARLGISIRARSFCIAAPLFTLQSN